MKALKGLVMAIAAVGVVAFANAAADDMIYAYASNVKLLEAPEVKKELGVTEAQLTEMRKHAAWHGRQLQALEQAMKDQEAKTGKKPELPVPQLQMLMEEMKRRVLSELTKVQVKRLGEISLQSLGPQAMVDPQVAKHLSITDAQRKKLAGLFEATGKKIAALTEAAEKPLEAKYKGKLNDEATKREFEKEAATARGKLEKDVAPILAQLNKDIDATITASQKKAWTELLGKPFQPKQS